MPESFGVWAPDASRVDLAHPGGTVSLNRDPTGWWFVEGELPAIERYGFLVDGEGPFPDPRSRRQPDGVHELSQVFDPYAHQMPDGAVLLSLTPDGGAVARVSGGVLLLASHSMAVTGRSVGNSSKMG